MMSYPHKYEVVIDRTSHVTGRPLVSLTVHKGDDETEARAEFERRRGSAGKGSRVRFEVRQTIAELQGR